MPTLINCTSPLAVNDAFAADLDIFDFSNYFLDLRERDEIAAWLRKYLTSDTEELRRRSGLIMELAKDDSSADRFAAIVKDIAELDHLTDDLPRKEGKLSFNVCMMRILELYIGTVQALEKEFEHDSVLCGAIRGFMNGNFRDAQEKLTAAREKFQPPCRVSIGVNISTTLNATHMGIIEVDTQRSTPGSLISGSDNITSLLDSVPNRKKSEMAHLEAYILNRIEKENGAEINHAHKILSGFDLSSVREWLDFAKSVEFYLAGLRYMSYLKRRNCPVGTAVYDSEFLGFSKLYYPHLTMVSEQKLPVPYTASVASGQATIITGANHSGKTSYLRAIAQCCVLAFLGFPVPAEEFRLPNAAGIYTVFAYGEDDSMQDSRFGMEAKMMREMLDTVSSGWLVFMNEPFTSTNPVESAEIICDIIGKLHDKNVTQMIVTHIYDVYYLLKDKNIPVSSHVTLSELDDEGIKCLYEVAEAEPDGNSYAHAIARQYGLEPSRLMDEKGAELVEKYLEGRRREC